MTNRSQYRQTRLKKDLVGTTIAELPVSLWIIFIGIAMPLLCLVLTTVRYGLFLEAAREAADVASQAQNYVGSGTGQSGAIALAQSQATAVAASFSGLSISPSDVHCWIVITPITTTGSSTLIGPDTALAVPADPTQNLYQIRVTVAGQIQPMVSMFEGAFVLPGLNAPIYVATEMTRVCENPTGLTQ